MSRQQDHSRSPDGMTADEMLREIYVRLVGDGSDDRPGLEKRVDRLEQRSRLTNWLAGTAIGAVLAFVVEWVVAKFSGAK